MTVAAVKKRGRPPGPTAQSRAELAALMQVVRGPDESVRDVMVRAFTALLPPVILPSAPATSRFWMVYNATKGSVPTKRHGSNAAARNEAIRLAKRFSTDTFVVLEARWGVRSELGDVCEAVQFGAPLEMSQSTETFACNSVTGPQPAVQWNENGKSGV